MLSYFLFSCLPTSTYGWMVTFASFYFPVVFLVAENRGTNRKRDTGI